MGPEDEPQAARLAAAPLPAESSHLPQGTVLMATVCAISLMKNNTNPLRVCNSSTTFDNKEIDKSMQNKLGKVLQTYRIPAPQMYSHEDQKFKASLGTQCCGTLLLLTANKHYSDWLTKSSLTNS